MTVSTSLWLFTFKTEQVVRQCHHKREAWKKYGGGSVPVTGQFADKPTRGV